MRIEFEQCGLQAAMQSRRGAVRVFCAVPLLAAAFLTTAFGPGSAEAQEYPTRPIRLVVPFPPGGANDIVARVIAPKLSESLGQPVVVDNRGGAAGTIGADHVAKSAADGYTLLMTPAPFVITQSLYSKLPYDGQKDFAPVALLTTAPFVLATPVSLPAKTLDELLALAKNKPGGVTFSSPGNGSPAHLAGELLKTRTGAPLLHVPYKGGGPAVADMVAGHVSFTLATPAEITQHVSAGKARALAVTTLQRTSLAPGVPTVHESGVRDFELTVWYGITVPAGTPPAVIARLNRELVAVMRQPDVQERMKSLGMDTTPSTPEAFGAFLKTEFTKWADLVKRSGAKAD